MAAATHRQRGDGPAAPATTTPTAANTGAVPATATPAGRATEATQNCVAGPTGAASAASLTLTTDLAVAHGGTGLSSFTGKGIVATNAGGTALSFLTSSLGTVGDFVQYNAAGVPVVSNIIDGGTY